MGRPSNTEARRAQIVEGMLEVVASRGYERATIKEIAQAAGLSSGLLHYHFPNKQAILVALLARLAEGLRARFARRLAQTAAGDSWGALEAYVAAHLSLDGDADGRALACWVALGAESVFLEDLRVHYAEVVAEDMAKLSELLRGVDPGLEGAELGAMVSWFYAAIQGVFLQSAAAPAHQPAPGWAQAQMMSQLRARLGSSAPTT